MNCCRNFADFHENEGTFRNGNLEVYKNWEIWTGKKSSANSKYLEFEMRAPRTCPSAIRKTNAHGVHEPGWRSVPGFVGTHTELSVVLSSGVPHAVEDRCESRAPLFGSFALRFSIAWAVFFGPVDPWGGVYLTIPSFLFLTDFGIVSQISQQSEGVWHFLEQLIACKSENNIKIKSKSSGFDHKMQLKLQLLRKEKWKVPNSLTNFSRQNCWIWSSARVCELVDLKKS